METYDVVVAGGGMGGLATAAALSLGGRSVLVVEKGQDVGGSMRMSGGSLWTASSMEAMESYVPGGDRTRQRQVVEGLPEAIAWLEELGIPPEQLRRDERRFGCEVDVELMTKRLSAIVGGGGGDIARHTPLVGVEADEAGRVCGVVVEAEGERMVVRAEAVVLATGGFQGSVELRQRFIPGWPDDLRLRSNPHSTGQALEAAVAIGAALSEGMDGFYGHTMPDIEVSPPQWTAVTAYASQDMVLVDMSGRRFFDESLSMADEKAPMAIVGRPGARAILVMDDLLYRGVAVDDRSPASGRAGASFDVAVALGASAVVGDTWELVADGLVALGVDRDGFLATIAQYNAALAAGRADELEVPRERFRVPLVEAPFRALLVRPGITFTLGGLAVDEEMRVLSLSGSPIPGLYAVGADAGGTYVGGYMGGLAVGLVQGRLAAASILGAG
jgi:succinate dehydrogenase/fumarate reductase flavoprotein subunit